MNKFRVILLSCVIVSTLLFSGTVYAQIDEELPNPGITPDSSFYFLDIWGKKIGLFFAFGAEAKARKALEYAEERLWLKNNSIKAECLCYDTYMLVKFNNAFDAMAFKLRWL